MKPFPMYQIKSHSSFYTLLFSSIASAALELAPSGQWSCSVLLDKGSHTQETLLIGYYLWDTRRLTRTFCPNSPYMATSMELLAAAVFSPYKRIYSHSISQNGPSYFCQSGGYFIVVFRGPVLVSLRLAKHGLCHPSLDVSPTANVHFL